MKKSGREKRAEISLALFMFLVFCLFISAFDGSQPRDVKMSDPPAFFAYIFHSFFFFLFSLCVSFPCHFLSISSSPPSTLCYSILLFSLHISPCLLHMIFLLFFIVWLLPSIFSFSVPFHFLFICILYCLQVFSLIYVYDVFSYCFCCCFGCLTYPGFA